LSIHPTDDNQQWTEDDLAVVETVVDQLAQSAERLRLFEETRERGSREQLLREITDKLRKAPNLDVLLETAARELGLRLGARHTVLEMVIEVGTDANGSDRDGPVETGQQE
jgi:GAF domain-containing protein